MFKRRRSNIYISTLLVCLCVSGTLVAQSASDRQVIGIAKAGGTAYIYHARQIPLSHGYNVFRSEDGKNWTQLNDEVIYPAKDGYDLQYRLDDQFAIARQLSDREEPQSVFLRLRSNTGVGLLANFASPEIAREMGRLYIDEEAPIGREVFYQFEIVDDLGRTTGMTIEGNVDLNVVEPPPPSSLELSNEGSQVEVNWQYVPNSDPSARFVIRFQIFIRKSESERWEPFNTEFLARTTGKTSFRYSSAVPQLGQNYKFKIHAVDFTGELSEESEIVEIAVIENIPPAIVNNVKASNLGDYKSRITWPVSTELDLMGYHVYRARGDEEVYTRITDSVLPPLQTVYEDSVEEPGNQFRYKITALDTLGNESKQSNPAYVFIEDLRIPDPVTNLEATLIENQKVTISWQSNTVPGELRSYQIFRREKRKNSEGLWTMLNSSAYTDNIYEDSGIGGTRFVEGTIVEYGIAVLSDNGSASDTVTTVLNIPDITPPESPTFLEATMQEARRVGLTWNASRSRDVTHYRLYKREAAKGPSSDSLLSELTKGERYFRDENVPLNKEYIYSVFAVDSVGNMSINMAMDTLLTSTTYAPERVRNVQAVMLDGNVSLAWELINQEGIDGYVIYKSKIATGVYEQVGEVDSATNNWTDTSGEAGVWYKVFARDYSGRESRSAKATQAIDRS